VREIFRTHYLEALACQARYRALWFVLLLLPLAAPLFQGKVFYDVSHLYQKPMLSESGQHRIQNDDLFDPVLMFYPNQALLRESLKSGQLPWWNPYNLFGYPFLANGQSGGLYPPRVVLLIVFDIATVQGLLIFFHLFFAGFLMSTLGRTFPLSGMSSLFLGTTWMFSGFVTAEMELGVAVTCAAWIPALLLLTQTCRRSWKAVAALGLATACFVSQGHLQYVAGSLLLVLVYGMFLLLRKTGGARAVFRATVGAVLGLFLASPLLVPTAFNLLNGSREKLPEGMPTAVHQQFLRTSPATFAFPELAGSPVTHFSFYRMPRGGTFAYWETVVFAGSLTLVLAILGMFQAAQPRFTAIFGLTVLFLPATKAYLWVQELPVFDRTFPARYLLLFHFCLVICAAFGFETLQQRRARWTGLLGFLVVGFGLYAMYFQVNFGRLWFNHGLANNTIRLPWPGGPRTIFAQKALLAFQATYNWSNLSFWLPILVLTIGSIVMLSKRATWILLLLTAGELFFFAQRWNPTAPKDTLFPDNLATRFLKENIGYDRVISLGAFEANTMRPHQVASVGGYEPSIPKTSLPYLSALFPKKDRYYGFPQLVGTRLGFDPRLLNLAGVRYIVTGPDMQMADLPLVHESTIRIYENPYRSPRVFLTGKQQINTDDQATLDLIRSGSINPLETVVLNSEPTEGLQEPVKGRASIVAYDLNEVKVQVETQNRAWLVLTDAYEPSWEARIDGKEVPVFRCFSLFRAVPVESGKHIIVFRYRPKGQGLTVILAGFSLFILLFLIVSPFRSSSKIQEADHADTPGDDIQHEGPVG
jgi:membrane protein YfhO